MVSCNHISVQPPCSMWLYGESLSATVHYRDTENTEVAQRKRDSEISKGNPRPRDGHGNY